MLYAVLRHFEVGGKKYLYILAAALALHFTSKETSYIYVAELLIYLAIYFFAKVTRYPWRENLADYRAFVISLSLSILLASAALAFVIYSRDASTLSGTETAIPSDPLAGTATQPPPPAGTSPVVLILAGATALALSATAFYMI